MHGKVCPHLQKSGKCSESTLEPVFFRSLSVATAERRALFPFSIWPLPDFEQIKKKTLIRHGRAAKVRQFDQWITLYNGLFQRAIGEDKNILPESVSKGLGLFHYFPVRDILCPALVPYYERAESRATGIIGLILFQISNHCRGSKIDIADNCEVSQTFLFNIFSNALCIRKHILLVQVYSYDTTYQVEEQKKRQQVAKRSI